MARNANNSDVTATEPVVQTASKPSQSKYASLGKGTNVMASYQDGKLVLVIDLEQESTTKTKGGRAYIAKTERPTLTIGDVEYNIGLWVTEVQARESRNIQL